MTHPPVKLILARDFESPASASSAIRAEGEHSRSLPPRSVVWDDSRHNSRHSDGADSGKVRGFSEHTLRARLRASRVAAGTLTTRTFPRPMGVWAAPHLRTDDRGGAA